MHQHIIWNPRLSKGGLVNLGRAIVMPEGSVPKVILSGDTLHVKLLSHSVQDSWTACVQYPDGYLRQHQVSNVIELLDKIAGQLKTRYNIQSFHFIAVPQALEPSTITIGEIKYA